MCESVSDLAAHERARDEDRAVADWVMGVRR